MKSQPFADILRQPFSWVEENDPLPASADVVIIGVAGVRAALQLA